MGYNVVGHDFSVSHQCVFNNGSLNRNTHKIRLYIDHLKKCDQKLIGNSLSISLRFNDLVVTNSMFLVILYNITITSNENRLYIHIYKYICMWIYAHRCIYVCMNIYYIVSLYILICLLLRPTFFLLTYGIWDVFTQYISCIVIKSLVDYVSLFLVSIDL